MNYGQELNISYDAIKELHDRAEFLKDEMQYIMNHRHHGKKIKAQAMVLHSVCSTIVTFTISWLENECTYEWDTFVVDVMGCCYLFMSIYNNMSIDFHFAFKSCHNSDELRDAFNWMVKVLGGSIEAVTRQDRYTWIYGK